MVIGQNFKRQTDFVLIDFLHIKIHMSRSKVAQDHPLSGYRACGQGERVGAYGPGKQIKITGMEPAIAGLRPRSI